MPYKRPLYKTTYNRKKRHLRTTTRYECSKYHPPHNRHTSRPSPNLTNAKSPNSPNNESTSTRQSIRHSNKSSPKRRRFKKRWTRPHNSRYTNRTRSLHNTNKTNIPKQLQQPRHNTKYRRQQIRPKPKYRRPPTNNRPRL